MPKVPKISLHRILGQEPPFREGTVKRFSFGTKHLKQKRAVITGYSSDKFVALLAEHVHARKEHEFVRISFVVNSAEIPVGFTSSRSGE